MIPLSTLGLACAAVAFACWVLSLVTREYSWVDRLWSILPAVYVVWIAWVAETDARLWLMAGLAVAWGVRLTFNFARKGGYAPGGEDYRWAALRQRLAPWQFQLLNFFFVAGVQNAILLGLALPAWVVSTRPTRPLGPWDALLAALFVAFLLGETVADEQQWRFHQWKKAAKERGEPIATPFCTTGLFRFSRHPNFFCEQAQWWVFYLIGVAGTGQWWNVSLAGPAVLTALFHGSTNFTEELTREKYPAYADYQARVSRLVPWLPAD